MQHKSLIEPQDGNISPFVTPFLEYSLTLNRIFLILATSIQHFSLNNSKSWKLLDSLTSLMEPILVS